MFTNHTPDMDPYPSTVASLADFVSDTPTPDPRPYENSDPFISSDTMYLIRSIFKCYVRQLLAFLGVPGNVVSCAVFFKQGLSDRINLLLFWLAVADLVHMASHLFFVPSCYLSDKIDDYNWAAVTDAKVTSIKDWSTFVSGSLIMIMSVDRCLSVVIPLKARRLLTYRPMVVAIVLCYLIPFMFHLIFFLAFTVQWRVDPTTNRSIAVVAKTPWFPMDSRLAPRICYFLTLIAKPVYLVIVTTCCVITISHLRHASRQRSQMTGGVKEKGDGAGDGKITKMLLFLCVVYAMVLSVEVCVAVMHSLFPEFYVYKKYHNTFISVYQMLVNPALCVNSTSNFFAYLVLSSRFRKTLKELFHCSP
ncbi:allatostatin-A receptor-like [Babylonia areolata]|uniref:allatostatin-A receptor-like n=1 Tax=Babylonia areolata TaxID=304850 RepID=UPI003FD23C69